MEVRVVIKIFLVANFKQGALKLIGATHDVINVFLMESLLEQYRKFDIMKRKIMWWCFVHKSLLVIRI